MTKKYLKIVALLIKNFFSIELVAKGILEYGFYFIFLIFVFKNLSYFSSYSYSDINIISAIYLIYIYLYKFFLENTLIFRYLLISGNFDLILVKPIDPIFRILINKVDVVGFFVSFVLIAATAYFGNLPNLLNITACLIISVSVFILVVSLLLKTQGKIPFERLLLLIFPIGIVGISGKISGLPILFVSILLLLISIKFWNYLLKNYVSSNS